MWDHIPEEIVADVLLKLPMDSVLRLRCVSKSWRDLIDSSHFSKWWLTKTDQNLEILAVSDGGMFSALEFDPNDCSVASAKQLNYSPGRSNNNRAYHLDLDLIGSCNGIICIHYSTGEIVLWNPWIQKHWKLPSRPTVYPFGTQVSFRLGFGYEHFNDDYKILNFLILRTACEVYLYSLKLNSWKRIICEFLWLFPNTWNPDSGAFANGALHWIVRKKSQRADEHFIISFDLRNEEFGQVMVCPRHQRDDLESQKRLRILDGNLCLLSYYYFGGGNQISLTVMKEYGVETSWTNIVTIRVPFDNQSMWNLTPITYNARGELFMQIEEENLAVCSPSTNYMEDVKIVGPAANCFASCACLRTLVRPCGGGGSTQ